MQIHELKRKTPLVKSYQVGRGGKRGKTSGKGGKGQTARAGRKLRPEMRDMIKKLPKLRGRGVHLNKSFAEKRLPVNLEIIELSFANGEEVTPSSLVKKGVLNASKGKNPLVKILGDGDFSKKVIISGCFISASAKEKVEKAGGKVIA